MKKAETAPGLQLQLWVESQAWVTLEGAIGEAVGHIESRRRQHAKGVQEAGFAAVEVIDGDLRPSGSGLVDRPGFRRLPEVTTGAIGCPILDVPCSKYQAKPPYHRPSGTRSRMST